MLAERRLHRISGWAILGLSLLALATVLTGFGQEPQADEGTGAHVFQLAVVAWIPAVLSFLATAEWNRPVRAMRPLMISVGFLVAAFVALYVLEHVFWRTA